MHLLGSALTRRGHAVTAFALNPPQEPADYVFEQIPLPDVVRNSPRAALYLAPWWVSRINFDKFDVIHAHGDDHFIRTQRPVIRTFYGTARAEARYSTKLRHKIYHLSVVPFELVSEQRATAVVAISSVTQRYLTRKAVLIPCGYDPSIFAPSTTKSVSPSILFVGDLGTRKRGQWLLEVFQRVVREAIPTAELWLVTTQPVSAPGTRWFGRVPTSKLVDLYRRAWLFCLPSVYEGFGVPYIEAMASGTTVVATPNGGAEEVLGAGQFGSIAQDHQLGRELVRLLNDNIDRDAFRIRGLNRAREYRIDLIAERYEALYDSLLRGGGKQPVNMAAAT